MVCSRSIATLLTSLGLGVAATLAQAGNGLQPPSSETIWPSLQARIAIQSATGPALGLSTLTGRLPAPAQGGGVRGGAVFGDYYFATPAFGSFRATSGLLIGAQGGAPQWAGSAGSRLGMALNSSSWPAPTASEPWATLPYLGVGFASQASEGGWSMSADLGLVAENATPGGLRRALGVQGANNAIRELRLSPVLQLGWRYSF